MRDSIIPSFPIQYQVYVEVFGGGAAILFAEMRPGVFEVYNDINSDLVNLFECVRNHPIEFCDEAGFLPITCPDEFKILRHMIEHRPVDPSIDRELQIAERKLKPPQLDVIREILEQKAETENLRRAVAFYKLLHMSYGSQGKSLSYQPFNIYSTLCNITKVSKRLSNTLILNRDFEFIIKKYDSPNTFFYLDPPYYQAEKVYRAVFTQENHYKLHELLTQIQGKFLLSYNDCEFIKDLYQDYFIVELSRPNSMIFHMNTTEPYRELLIANYDLNERRRSMASQLSIFEEGENNDYLADFRKERQGNDPVCHSDDAGTQAE